MQSTFVTFQKVCKHHKISKSDWKINRQYNYIEFFNGSRIDLLDLKFLPSDPDYERYGSLEYTGGWIEEASETKFKAFDVLKSRIGRHMNKEFGLLAKMLLTFNPSKKWLYKMIYKPWKNKELPKEYKFIQSLYGDNPHTAEDYGKMLRQIRDKATKQRLMFGNWEYDDDPGKLIEYDNILDMFTNTVPKDNQRYLTGDIARFGQDKIVIMLWKGFEVYKLFVWQKQGLDVTEDKLRDLLRDEFIPYSHAIVDEGGMGGGIVDNLGVKGFVSNSSSLKNPKTDEKENYRNLKAQVSYMFAEKVNKHGISIKAVMSENDQECIIEEVDQIRGKDLERDAPKQLVPKEEIKEMIGRSPDYSDCIIQRMWFELTKPKDNEVSTTISSLRSYRRR